MRNLMKTCLVCAVVQTLTTSEFVQWHLQDFIFSGIGLLTKTFFQTMATSAACLPGYYKVSSVSNNSAKFCIKRNI